MSNKLNIKLKKYLSNSGYCSRRKADQFIQDNSILINDIEASHDSILEHKDVILINKERRVVNLNIGTEILIYHKPVGEICSSEGTKKNISVFEALPSRSEGKWIMVGRLDINTSGLLIFSNNGDLVQKLSHPSSMIERNYLCRIFGKPNKSQINNLLKGVEVDGRSSTFDKLISINKKSRAQNTWYRATLHSGRNREVRKLWESQSLQVSRLIRIGFGPIVLPEDLKSGQYKSLSANEIKKVMGLIGLKD